MRGRKTSAGKPAQRDRQEDPGAAPVDPKTAAILDSVLQIFRSDGYEAVTLRTIAREARVSLATIYRQFPSRDELCLAAMQRWMQQQVYGALPRPPASMPLLERVVLVQRHALLPYIRDPAMLEAFARLRLSPAGRALRTQGEVAMRAVSDAVWAGVDQNLRRDAERVLYHVMQSLIMHFAVGEIAIDELLPTLERSARLLLRQR
jgi:AcrR family transcriptional regulator